MSEDLKEWLILGALLVVLLLLLVLTSKHTPLPPENGNRKSPYKIVKCYTTSDRYGSISDYRVIVKSIESGQPYDVRVHLDKYTECVQAEGDTILTNFNQ